MPYVKSSVNYKSRSRRSRGRRRRFVAALVTVALVLVAALLLRPRSHAAPAQRPPAQTFTVAAVLRRPAPAWGAASRSDLRNALESALAPALDDGGSCSCVVIAQDGSLLYDNGGSRALTPASTQKLIVTDAALADLGPQFRFDTLIAASQEPRNGALDGNLWLAGSGDPSLRTSDLRNAVLN